MASAVALHDVVHATSPDALALLTCVRDRTVLARLQEALRGRGDVRTVSGLAELIATLRLAVRHPDIVVVPQRDSFGRESPSVVREIAEHFPKVAIIAYCRTGVEHSADIRALAMAGVHQFLFSDEDTRIAVQAVVENARRECAAERVYLAFSRVLPPKVHPIAEACIHRPSIVREVKELARATGLHRKTLYNQCVSVGAPPPAELVGWCRLGLVADLLTHTGRTVESLANDLEFASPSALRNMIKRYTGLRANEVRAEGGVDCVARALARRIEDLRPGLRLLKQS